MNKLYFGDNLDMLRRHIKDETVDLVYLDPPFNSNANYNVLFKERGDRPSEAQAEAFKDTWEWGPAAAIAYDELVTSGGPLAGLVRSLREWLGDTGLMAYLVMMGVRLVELHRVLKDTGSLYLHCDPTASHYIKIMLDGIFGHKNFRNEIIWQRTNAHNFKSKSLPRVHDVLLFYTVSDKYTYNQLYGDFSPQQLERYEEEPVSGRLFTGQDMTIIGGDMTPWRGTTPNGERGWGLSLSEREKLWKAGMVLKRKDGSPRLDGRKVYLDQKKGVPICDVWTDVKRIANTSGERLGYPTQKPIGLLERILKTSTDEGSVVLDPFCGCGTTVEAAERMKREWIGIDVTHYAVTLIEKRLKALPNAKFQVVGRPTDLAGAQDLARRDKYQFQWWASWLLGAQTYDAKKGADRGIDGNVYFLNGPYGHGRIIVSVKGGDQLSPVMVRELAGTVDREKAEMGVLIILGEPTKAMSTEAAGHGFVPKSAHGRLPRIKILTVQDLLDGRTSGLPPIPRLNQHQPRRKSAKDRDQLELLFPFEGDGLKTGAGTFIDPGWLSFTAKAKRS